MMWVYYCVEDCNLFSFFFFFVNEMVKIESFDNLFEVILRLRHNQKFLLINMNIKRKSKEFRNQSV